MRKSINEAAEAVRFRIIRIAVLVLLAAAPPLRAEEPIISGIVNAAANAAAGAGDSSAFLLGTEEYANLRLEADVGDWGTVYTAVNLIASSGTNGAASFAAGAETGENYTAALELERLYARFRGETIDADIGLMRIPFGYGQGFRPTDFLNPPNPMIPDARPRGILGALVSVYPSLDAKLQGFLAGGPDPLKLDGEGSLLGLAAEGHFSRASVQALYAFQASGDGVHRIGLSLKADMEVTLVMDALCSIEGDALGIDGLEIAFGADYSFIDGKLFTLVQYLYNGPGLLDPDEGLDALLTAPSSDIGVYNRKNYLLAQSLYQFSDFTRAGLSCLASLDDLSFSPALTAEHEPAQGLTLGLTARLYLDEKTLLGSGNRGELGSEYTGMYGLLTATAKMKF